MYRATTKYFSNSFVFKNKIEKEGLREHGPAGLGAGGPEFKSRRLDHSLLRFPFAVLDVTVSVCPPETDLADSTLLP